MRTLVIILGFLISLNLCGQNKTMLKGHRQKTVKIYTVEELIRILETKGISHLKSITDPINLLYVDSTLVKKIIDTEFKSILVKKQAGTVGIYRYDVPFLTEEIAKYFNEKYAANKLYEYYKQIPKLINSDTIYQVYSQLDKLLTILIHYNPLGLNQQLKIDYYYWQRLAKTTSSYNNNGIEDKIIGSDHNTITLESDLHPDYNLIILQLASALYLLKEPSFSEGLCTQLKKKDNNTNYEFPSIRPTSYFNAHFKEKEITLKKSYHDFSALLINIDEFEKNFLNATGERKSSKIYEIIHDKKTGYVETYDADTGTGYSVKLNNNKMIIQWVWNVQE